MSNSAGKSWEGSCSDTSSSPPVKGESEVLSPDEATPPVPVASSSPLPVPVASSSSLPLPVTGSSPLPLQAEQDLEDEETEEIVSHEPPVSPAAAGSGAASLARTPTAPSKGQGKPLEGRSPELKKGRRKLQLQPTKKRVSTTKKAGLVLSVARINKRLKAGRYARRIGLTAAVYMASVLEYLVAEVLELAGNCARYFRKQRVFPRCIQLTLLHDKELFQLTRGAIVPQGGVKPFIHPVLMTGKSEDQTPPPTAHNKEDWYGDGGP